MSQFTHYQLVKLGSNLEYLSGICSSILLAPISGMEKYPHLIENLPNARYSVVRVVGVIKSLLIQLEELQLTESLHAAEAFRPMLQEMEEFLQGPEANESSYLHNPFAERLVAIAKQVLTTVKSELNKATSCEPKNAEQQA